MLNFSQVYLHDLPMTKMLDLLHTVLNELGRSSVNTLQASLQALVLQLLISFNLHTHLTRPGRR